MSKLASVGPVRFDPEALPTESPVVCGGRWGWRVPSIGPFGITIAGSGRLRGVLRGAR